MWRKKRGASLRRALKSIYDRRTARGGLAAVRWGADRDVRTAAGPTSDALPPLLKCLSPSFRATGITMHQDAGGDIEAARQLAGHASVKTTQLYNRSGDKTRRAEVERVQL